MQAGDELFFHKLLLILCGAVRSVIRGGTSKSYYCEVENILNMYGMQLGLCWEYGHKFVNIFLDE